MTPVELKENLIKQYNEVVTSLKVLEGAVAACDALLNEETTEEVTTEETTNG